MCFNENNNKIIDLLKIDRINNVIKDAINISYNKELYIYKNKDNLLISDKFYIENLSKFNLEEKILKKIKIRKLVLNEIKNLKRRNILNKNFSLVNKIP